MGNWRPASEAILRPLATADMQITGEQGGFNDKLGDLPVKFCYRL